MITFQLSHTPIDMRTVQKCIYLLGTITACALILAALWLVFWLVQECLQAIAEITHLISTTNPIVIAALVVLISVFLLGKVKR